MDARFLSVVEVGQYSWLKTLENNFMQRLVVNTLFQEKLDHHNQEDGSRETRILDPYWKLWPVVYTANMELKLESGLWVKTTLTPWIRISYGSNKFVMDSNNNDIEVPEDQPQEQVLQLDVRDFACRSKAKAKPQRREPAGYSPKIIPMNRRTWIDIEPGKYSLSEYEVSKKIIYLLRHSQQVQWEKDGAVHSWKIKENLQKYFLY